MATFTELAAFNETLIRKALQATVWIAPQSVEDEIDSLKDATGLLVPLGYEPVGRLTTEGISLPRDVTVADVNSLGASQPSRRDVTSDVSSIGFTMQESKKSNIGLYDDQDLSAVTYDANGNVYWDKPDRSAGTYHRLLAMFKDGDGADAVYGAVWMPRAQVTDRGEIVWNADDEIRYNVTLTAFADPTFGTAVRTIWAGPVDRLTAMGFTAATP